MATFAKSTFSHASYAAFRPQYSSALYNTLIAYHQGPRRLCLDLGCGTGAVTREMSKHFNRVTGVDPSPGMIEQARHGTSSTHSPGVSFQQGSAEALPGITSASVDCVVSGQAAHWFDQLLLWPELRRVLRPGGTVAFWSYKEPTFVDFPMASKILELYVLDLRPGELASYWPQPGSTYCREKLRVIQPPKDGWEDVRRVEYEPAVHGKRSGDGVCFMEANLTVERLKEYMRTWSAYHGWVEAHPDMVARSKGGKGDVIDQMMDELAADERCFEDERNVVKVEWGSGLVMARRKP